MPVYLCELYELSSGPINLYHINYFTALYNAMLKMPKHINKKLHIVVKGPFLTDSHHFLMCILMYLYGNLRIC